MKVTLEDVKHYVGLLNELVNIVHVLVPKKKTKDYVKKVSEFLNKNSMNEAVVVAFKLVEDVKVLVGYKDEIEVVVSTDVVPVK